MAAETCENCDRRIGKLEEPWLHGDSIVCKDCWERLTVQSKPSPPSAQSATQSGRRPSYVTVVVACGLCLGIAGTLAVVWLVNRDDPQSTALVPTAPPRPASVAKAKPGAGVAIVSITEPERAVSPLSSSADAPIIKDAKPPDKITPAKVEEPKEVPLAIRRKKVLADPLRTVEEMISVGLKDEVDTRWALLSRPDRDRVAKIRRTLAEGTGTDIAPADFLFVYSGPGYPFANAELREAVSRTGLGPYVDFVSKRLGFNLAKSLHQRKLFDEAAIVDEGGVRETGSFYYQGLVWSIAESFTGGIPSDFQGLSHINPDLNVYAKLGVIIKRVDSGRPLSDDEIEYARKFGDIRDYVAAHIKKTKGGFPNPTDPKVIAERIAEQNAFMAELAARADEHAKARKADLAKATATEDAVNATKRAAAAKTLAAIIKRLDPMYPRREKMRNADSDNPRAQQALDKLDTDIESAEEELTNNLQILLPNYVRGYDKSETELEELFASLFPADKKTQQLLNAHFRRERGR